MYQFQIRCFPALIAPASLKQLAEVVVHVSDLFSGVNCAGLIEARKLAKFPYWP